MHVFNKYLLQQACGRRRFIDTLSSSSIDNCQWQLAKGNVEREERGEPIHRLFWDSSVSTNLKQKMLHVVILKSWLHSRRNSSVIHSFSFVCRIAIYCRSWSSIKDIMFVKYDDHFNCWQSVQFWPVLQSICHQYFSCWIVTLNCYSHFLTLNDITVRLHFGRISLQLAFKGETDTTLQYCTETPIVNIYNNMIDIVDQAASVHWLSLSVIGTTLPVCAVVSLETPRCSPEYHSVCARSAIVCRVRQGHVIHLRPPQPTSSSVCWRYCGSCPRGDDADVWSTVSLMLWTGVLRRGSSLTQTKPNGYDLAPHHFCSLIITVGHNVIKPANCVCRTVDVPTCFACHPNVFLPSAPFALCTSATRPWRHSRTSLCSSALRTWLVQHHPHQSTSDVTGY